MLLISIQLTIVAIFTSAFALISISTTSPWPCSDATNKGVSPHYKIHNIIDIYICSIIVSVWLAKQLTYHNVVNYCTKL